MQKPHKMPITKNQPTGTGIYVITNNEPFDLLYKKLAILCASPITFLQYRRKNIAPTQQLKEIEKLATLCLQSNVALIINDSTTLAQQFDCGVHLGQDDGSINDARSILGESAIIGRTCHQSILLAQQAQIDGANYVAFGTYHPSKNKPLAKQVDDHTLQLACNTLNIATCVIGGLGLSDIQALKNIGITYYAMIDGLLAGSISDVSKKAETIRQLSVHHAC